MLFARFVYRTSQRYLVFTGLTLTHKCVALEFLVIIYIRKRSDIWIGFILNLILLLFNHSEDKVQSIFPCWSAQSFYRFVFNIFT